MDTDEKEQAVAADPAIAVMGDVGEGINNNDAKDEGSRESEGDVDMMSDAP